MPIHPTAVVDPRATIDPSAEGRLIYKLVLFVDQPSGMVQLVGIFFTQKELDDFLDLVPAERQAQYFVVDGWQRAPNYVATQPSKASP